MRHTLRHRVLCALAAVSLVFSAVPVNAAATFADGHLPACSVSDGSPASDAGGSDPAPAATVTVAGLDTRGQPCGPGPCSMPFTTCASAGACLSAVPLPATASTALSSGLSSAPASGIEHGSSSPASRILTPPPRG